MTTHILTRSALGLAVLALAACGGGGGDGDAAPPVVPSLSLSGTAATGAALAGASVAIKCATGAATATTDGNGTYAVTVTGGTLPCLLRATSADGSTVLHSVAEGSGSSSTPLVANITPVTELVLARMLASADTSGAFDTFDNPTRELLSTARAASAVAALQTALTPVDPTFASMDLLHGSFKASTGDGGDATDRAIDALVAQVTAAAPDATTAPARLQALLTVLAQVPAPALQAVANHYLAPPIAGCPALRNVLYRFVGTYGDVFKGSNLNWASGWLSLTTNGGTTEAMTVIFNGTQACEFTARGPNTTLDGYASSAGVVVLKDQGDSNRSPNLGVGFPEQKLSVSDLAGTWNFVGYGFRSGYNAFRNSQSVVTFDAQGTITASLDCRGTATSNDPCISSLSQDAANTIVANPDGGFLAVDGHGKVMPGNIFAFRNATGTMMMVITDPDGGLSIGTRQVAVPLPSAGTVTNYRNVGLSQTQGMARLNINTSTSQYTFQSVDAVASAVTRQRILLNGAPNGRIDIKQYNQPRTGLLFSRGSSYTLNGVATNQSDALMMPIPGMGLAFEVHPGGATVPSSDMFLGVSIVQ